MKAYIQSIKILLIAGLILFLPKYNFAQAPSSYKMEFVRAITDNSGKGDHIIAVFQIIPTIEDFKLILSMKLAYNTGHGEKVVNIQKQTEEENVRIEIFGSDVEQKDQQIYDLIKDKVKLETEEDVYLLVFDFHGISKKKISKISITYGLWESNDPDVRNEQQFSFAVETL